MIYRMNPEEIRDEGYRRVYVRLLELHLDEDMSQAAFDSTDGRFLAANFIRYFNRRREFTEGQISYVDFVYDRVKRRKDAGLIYKKNGFLDELIEFMSGVANGIPVNDRSSGGHKGNLIQKMNELTRGRMLYGNQFSALKFCIGLLPAEKQEEYKRRVDELCGKYWEIYNGLRDRDRSLRDKDRSLRDQGGENGAGY